MEEIFSKSQFEWGQDKAVFEKAAKENNITMVIEERTTDEACPEKRVRIVIQGESADIRKFWRAVREIRRNIRGIFE